MGDDKCFLVNLNADPALNELLVYYLKVGDLASRALYAAQCFYTQEGMLIQKTELSSGFCLGKLEYRIVFGF